LSAPIRVPLRNQRRWRRRERVYSRTCLSPRVPIPPEWPIVHSELRSIVARIGAPERAGTTSTLGEYELRIDAALDVLRDETIALDSSTAAILDLVCRKIALAPTLWSAYLKDGTRGVNAIPLSSATHARLIAGLLHAAEHLRATDPDERGRALKCLNGA